MSSKTWTGFHQHTAQRAANDGVMQMLLRGVADGFRRARQRRDLAALSDHHLRDIGLSRTDVEAEIGKPFWRG
jgi:uncharacterized protein YjiS (DUF1127 family)